MINRLIFILAAAGLLVSGYLLERYVSGGRIACGTDFGCDLVRKSQYSHLFGIPLPLYGLTYYLIILGLSFVKTIRSFRLLSFTLLTISLIGLLMSSYLFYLEVFAVHAICFWCTVSGVITLLIFGLMVKLTSDEW
jgi:uncharacterized membrane protein